MAVEVADDAACTDYEEATSASMEAPSDCCGADADVTATAMAAESDCCSEGAEVAMAANMDACAMQAAGVCADGDDCPMQAAGNEDCDMMGTKDCPMEQAKAKAAAAAAVQTSLIMGEGCCAGKTVAEACPDCAAKATAAAMKQCEGMDPAHCEGMQGDCPMAAAKAAATAAAGSESCAMQAAGICADGDDCPMQAAGNEDCDMMGTKDCPMEQAKAKAAAAAAVQASLIMGEGCCAGKTVAEACPDCAAKATAAAMKQCEGMDPAECEAKGGCPSMEAPASVKTGATEATQAGAAKEDSSCCSSKSAEPSN